MLFCRIFCNFSFVVQSFDTASTALRCKEVFGSYLSRQNRIEFEMSLFCRCAFDDDDDSECAVKGIVYVHFADHKIAFPVDERLFSSLRRKFFVRLQRELSEHIVLRDTQSWDTYDTWQQVRRVVAAKTEEKSTEMHLIELRSEQMQQMRRKFDAARAARQTASKEREEIAALSSFSFFSSSLCSRDVLFAILARCSSLMTMRLVCKRTKEAIDYNELLKRRWKNEVQVVMRWIGNASNEAGPCEELWEARGLARTARDVTLVLLAAGNQNIDEQLGELFETIAVLSSWDQISLGLAFKQRKKVAQISERAVKCARLSVLLSQMQWIAKDATGEDGKEIMLAAVARSVGDARLQSALYWSSAEARAAILNSSVVDDEERTQLEHQQRVVDVVYKIWEKAKAEASLGRETFLDSLVAELRDVFAQTGPVMLPGGRAGVVTDVVKAKFVHEKRAPVWLVFRSFDNANIECVLDLDARDPEVRLSFSRVGEAAHRAFREDGFDVASFLPMAVQSLQGMHRESIMLFGEPVRDFSAILREAGGGINAFLSKSSEILSDHMKSNCSSLKIDFDTVGLQRFRKSYVGAMAVSIVAGMSRWHNDSIAVTKACEFKFSSCEAIFGYHKTIFGLRRRPLPVVAWSDMIPTLFNNDKETLCINGGKAIEFLLRRCMCAFTTSAVCLARNHEGIDTLWSAAVMSHCIVAATPKRLFEDELQQAQERLITTFDFHLLAH